MNTEKFLYQGGNIKSMIIQEERLKERIRREILSGAILIPPPMLGDNKLPTNVEITNIKTKEFVEFLTTGLEEIKDIALQGVSSLQDYVGEAELKNPDIRFEIPNSKEELEIPKLDSFEFDDRIIIKPVDSVGYEHEVSGKANFKSIESRFQFTQKNYTTTHFKRVYALGPDLIPNIQRLPLIWSVKSLSKTDKIASLALEVLTIQLEPITSSRVKYRIMAGYPPSSEGNVYFNCTNQLAQYEESLVAVGITRAWLSDKAGEFGLSEDDIKKWLPRNLYPARLELALKQVREYSATRVIHAYKTNLFNLTAFLDGSLLRHLYP